MRTFIPIEKCNKGPMMIDPLFQFALVNSTLTTGLHTVLLKAL